MGKYEKIQVKQRISHQTYFVFPFNFDFGVVVGFSSFIRSLVRVFFFVCVSVSAELLLANKNIKDQKLLNDRPFWIQNSSLKYERRMNGKVNKTHSKNKKTEKISRGRKLRALFKSGRRWRRRNKELIA